MNILNKCKLIVKEEKFHGMVPLITKLSICKPHSLAKILLSWKLKCFMGKCCPVMGAREMKTNGSSRLLLHLYIKKEITKQSVSTLHA